MEIALIAHDKKKDDMIRFVTAYQDIFAQHRLYATGTTGKRINEETNLPVIRFSNQGHMVVIKNRSINCQ